MYYYKNSKTQIDYPLIFIIRPDLLFPQKINPTIAYYELN